MFVRKIGLRKIGLMGALLCPLWGWGASYPVEFADFFARQPGVVVVRLAGDAVGLKVEALASYDGVQLSPAGDAPLRRYLADHGLASGAVVEITRALSQGVQANPGCKVNLDVCAPPVAGQEIAYVFDYDNGNLTIFVGSAWWAHAAHTVTYHSARRVSNALVNQARLYGYADESANGGVGVSVANLTTLGLPYGHLQFNTQYQSAERTLDVYQGVYDLEFGATRAVLGYSERDRVFFNTTDFLNNDADYTSFAAQVGSSRHLVRGGSARLQSVLFFAPQAGQLEVYQGDRLLLTRVVTQGRQAIAYSDLPAGAYDVRLVLRAGGQIVLTESRQIVNAPQFNLPVADWDYVATVGRFDQGTAPATALPRAAQPYAQLRSAWRVTDSLLLAGGSTATQDDGYAQVGMSYAWRDWLLTTYQVGLFRRGAHYQSGTLAVGPLSLSARRFERDAPGEMDLAAQLYGDASFFNYSATYAAALWGGSGYVTYAHYARDSAIPSLGPAGRVSSTAGDLSAGWMTAWRGWQWGVNAAYNQTDTYDELKFGVTASYALGRDTTSQLSLTTDRQGLSRSEAGITQSMARDNWSGSGTTTLAWQRDQATPTEAAVAGAVNGHTEWFNASAYGYVNSGERRMVSGTLSGTQFIAAQGAGMTPEMGVSFMHIVPDRSAAPDVSLAGVSYNVRRDAHTTYQGRLSDTTALLPLTPYTDTEVVLDAESRTLQIDPAMRRDFVYPGTVYTLDARVTPLVTQLFVLNDILGHPIRQARCVGVACAGVEPLSDDGVFRVKYRAGSPFTLLSMNRVCLNEPTLAKEGVIYTYCLPGLMSEEGRLAFSSSGQPQASDWLYLGKYVSHQEASAIVARLQAVGLTVHAVTVGPYQYLYVRYRQHFNAAQRALLEQLEAYIVLNDADVDTLFSAK
ncbi:TcfC E-set like domain-containing protein [Aeromonas hydrophila]|uniref:TcfC E-set like domain-containing protein n=1 Tax=Aeromonas hydrophila TaxID=644 RepID=UPI0035BB7DDB